jgi:copper chaperone CopZ
MISASYRVTGMSGGHCIASIIEELRTVPGVVEVAVDLPSGRVDLTAERCVSDDEFRQVVEQAGFGVPATLAG